MNLVLKNWLKANRLNLLLATAGLAPLLWVFGNALWHRSAYQFFPLALVATGLLAGRAAREFSAHPVRGKSRMTTMLALAAGLVFLAGNILWSPWLGIFAGLLVLIFFAWSLGGGRALKVFLPGLLMLSSIIPPPLGGDEILTLWLRSMAVVTSSCLLDVLKVVHTLEGNTILLPGKSLLVVEACSGINSVLLGIALCLFWSLWQRRPPGWLLAALPLTCAFVWLGNVLRITTGAALYYYYQIDWLSGRAHEIFGLALILGYGALIWSLDQLLAFLGRQATSIPAGHHDRNNPMLPPGEDDFSPKPVARTNRNLAWFLAVVGVGFCIGRIIPGGSHAVAPGSRMSTPRDLPLSLPAEIAGWRQLNNVPETSFAETLGVRSLIWRYAGNGAELVVAVDYPLEGFHNVKACYFNNGWQIKTEEKIMMDQGSTSRPTFKLALQRSICQHAVVFHAVLNERGEWLQPPVHKEGWQVRLLGNTAPTIQTSYRIQVFTGAYAPIPDNVEQGARELFNQASLLLRRQMMGQFAKPITH